MTVSLAVRIAMTVAVFLLIVVLSIVPGRSRPGDSAFVWLVASTPMPLQKLLHFVAYAVLAMLLTWTLEKIPLIAVRLGVVLVTTVTIGAALEWYQTSVPGRFGTLEDVFLNAGGAIFGALVAVFLL